MVDLFKVPSRSSTTPTCLPSSSRLNRFGYERAGNQPRSPCELNLEELNRSHDRRRRPESVVRLDDPSFTRGRAR
jgi:hypothetical protein